MHLQNGSAVDVCGERPQGENTPPLLREITGSKNTGETNPWRTTTIVRTKSRVGVNGDDGCFHM